MGSLNGVYHTHRLVLAGNRGILTSEGFAPSPCLSDGREKGFFWFIPHGKFRGQYYSRGHEENRYCFVLKEMGLATNHHRQIKSRSYISIIVLRMCTAFN